MQIKLVQDAATRFLNENATTVLTAGGVVGTVATAILSVRAGMKAQEVVDVDKLRQVKEQVVEDDEPKIEPLSKTETFKRVWPYFVPPIATGTATIAAIIMADRMSAKRAAALAAAYGVAQGQFEEYKAKVEEKLGLNKKEKLDDELAQDRVNREAPKYGQLIVIEGEVLCFDEPTGRFFNSTVERIDRAANAVNGHISMHGYASAQMFYDELELPPCTWADDVGFNLDNKLELKISSTLTPDNKPCVSIDFRSLPKTDYMRMHS